MANGKPVSTAALRRMKREGEPIAMITAYDYPSAKHADEAGADVILVGDSLGNVVLGYETTMPVTLDDMIYHTKAGDPCGTAQFRRYGYAVSDLSRQYRRHAAQCGADHAGRLGESGQDGRRRRDLPSRPACAKAGIPVMGHIGLTPQAIHQLGGYNVQGKTSAKAEKLLDDAKRLEEAGVFAIVLELVPGELAAAITEQLEIPTIGIGAGRHCDGQVLVFHDVLNYGASGAQKIRQNLRRYRQAASMRALRGYVGEVKRREFPDASHTFAAEDSKIGQLYGAEHKV